MRLIQVMICEFLINYCSFSFFIDKVKDFIVNLVYEITKE